MDNIDARMRMLEQSIRQIQRSIGVSQLHNPLTSNPGGQSGTGQLTVGGSGGGLGNINVYSGASAPGPGGSTQQVFWLGAMVDNGAVWWGAWGSDIFLGGTGPHNATNVTADITGTPVNTTTPVKWLKVTVAGTLYFVPLFQ